MGSSVKFQITFRHPADKDLIKWKSEVSHGDASYTIREALRAYLKRGEANTPSNRKDVTSKALRNLDL